jgi:RNA polymerase sigma factor (sigma-70 family)
MPDANDMDLVREFADGHSEAAFAELVQRHINLVYSVALRFAGDPTDAQDVTQAVFIILAQKAASLRQRTILTGWLYETTRLTAMKFLRTKIRRQTREQEAYMQSTLNDSNSDSVWKQLGPLLEEGMTRLSEKERTLLALRFFENKTGSETAAILGIQEWAAHKRVNRAVEKLRLFFTRRGVVVPAAALTAAIAANSVQAAPVGLAVTISATAVKGAAVAASVTTLVNVTIKTIFMTTIEKTLVTAAIAAAIAVPIIWQQRAIHQLKNQNRILELKLAAARPQPRGKNVSATQPAALREPSTLPPPQVAEKSSDHIAEALRVAADMENRNPATALKFFHILSELSGDELAELFQRGMQLQDAKVRRNLCQAVIGFWAEKDPASAVEMAMKTSEPSLRDESLSTVINRWALKDAAGALTWYREAVQQENGPLSTDRSRRSALQFIATGLAQSNPQQAFALLDETTDPGERASVLQGVAFLARDESQRDTLWQKIDQMTAPNDRRMAASAFIREWGIQDSAGASAFVEKLPVGDDRTIVAMNLLLSTLFAKDREAASSWVLGLAPETKRSQTITLIAEVWSSHDLRAAGEWLNRQGSGPEMDPAVSRFATLAAARDPATAMNWAQTVTDATMRDNSIKTIAQRWLKVDAPAAQTWIANSALPEQMKADLLRR